MLESRETPMHVGGFNLFTLPEGADEQQFLHGLADNMRTADALQSPFGDKLKVGRLGMLGPLYWEPDNSLDLEYHIRHSALPKPGRFRELFASMDVDQIEVMTDRDYVPALVRFFHSRERRY